MPKDTRGPGGRNYDPKTAATSLFGLYYTAPALDSSTIREAAKILSVSGEEQAHLAEKLNRLVGPYWEAWHASRWKDTWHAEQIQPVLKTASALLGATQGLPPSTKALLRSQTRRRFLQPPNSTPERSLQEMLTNLIAVCESLSVSGHPGAPTKAHIAATVHKLMAIWSSFTKRKFPITLKTAKVKTREGADEVAFWSPAAQFVLTVMRAIDSSIETSAVAGAIRSGSNRRPKVKKPLRTSGHCRTDKSFLFSGHRCRLNHGRCGFDPAELRAQADSCR